MFSRWQKVFKKIRSLFHVHDDVKASDICDIILGYNS